MSQLIASHHGSSTRRQTFAVRAWLARLAAACAREWRYHRDLAALQELDSRALHDLGITSGGLEHLVRNGRPFRSVQATEHRSGRPDTECRRGPIPSSWTEWR